MSMNLKSRLSRLERILPVHGRCKCKGVQPPCGVYYEDDPLPAVPEKRCDACGGLIEPLIIHVVYDSKAASDNETDPPTDRERAEGRAARKRHRACLGRERGSATG
jgi:hypothetical protein